MIKIDYDPVDGKVVADAEAFPFMEKVLTKKKPKSIEVGNYTMIMAVPPFPIVASSQQL